MMTDIIEAHICWVRVCEHCQDKTKEAFPYNVKDQDGKEWGILCNECFDELGCAYEPINWNEAKMDLCSISHMPYDECDGNHEDECKWQCGECGGNVYNCTCDEKPDWTLDPRRNGATNE